MVRRANGLSARGCGHAELNATGLMHNRVHGGLQLPHQNLLIDWRWGEAPGEKRSTSSLAATTAGGNGPAWQRCDAALYFRAYSTRHFSGRSSVRS